MSEILFGSASDAASRVARREVSSRELTEEMLAWIERVDGAVNAVVELRGEAALREAAAADVASDDLAHRITAGFCGV